jgi:hypothetical protein
MEAARGFGVGRLKDRAMLRLLLALSGAFLFSETAVSQRLLPYHKCEELQAGACVHQSSGRLFCVCQDGRYVITRYSGLLALTKSKTSDMFVVTQVGAKSQEARVYRPRGNSYVQVGEWSGWSIRTIRRCGTWTIAYEELQPTVEHPLKIRYFGWRGGRFTQIR